MGLGRLSTKLEEGCGPSQLMGLVTGLTAKNPQEDKRALYAPSPQRKTSDAGFLLSFLVVYYGHRL